MQIIYDSFHNIQKCNHSEYYKLRNVESISTRSKIQINFYYKQKILPYYTIALIYSSEINKYVFYCQIFKHYPHTLYIIDPEDKQEILEKKEVLVHILYTFHEKRREKKSTTTSYLFSKRPGFSPTVTKKRTYKGFALFFFSISFTTLLNCLLNFFLSLKAESNRNQNYFFFLITEIHKGKPIAYNQLTSLLIESHQIYNQKILKKKIVLLCQEKKICWYFFRSDSLEGPEV